MAEVACVFEKQLMKPIAFFFFFAGSLYPKKSVFN